MPSGESVSKRAIPEAWLLCLPASWFCSPPAVVPDVLRSVIVWSIDRCEREPLPLAVATCLWGALPAALVALPIEAAFSWVRSELADEVGLTMTTVDFESVLSLRGRPAGKRF
jgi:hypothetical protein